MFGPDTDVAAAAAAAAVVCISISILNKDASECGEERDERKTQKKKAYKQPNDCECNM